MKIAVLASGEGTNAKALIDASKQGDLSPGDVVALISDRHDAGALRLARDAGVDAAFIDPAPYDSRSSYGEVLLEALVDREVDLLCLAGFMRILGSNVIRGFPDRILNVHPALLPAFPGARAVREALQWGVKVTGATVHFADEEIDNGPIIIQEAVEVLPDDDEKSLHGRIKTVEHRIYPYATSLVCAGRIRVDGRKVMIEDGAMPPGKS
jgi:phosphoribosylglycinamide formyltransferase-1